jgi:2Fe-2S ferredoxin
MSTGSSLQLRYIDVDGKAHQVDASVGDTLMQVGTSNLVRGIDGDCGGNCACGTCLIKLEDHVAKQLAPPAKDERELLAFLGRNEPTYRLGCQIRLTSDLHEIIATVPKA